jgi:hypothetical protein
MDVGVILSGQLEIIFGIATAFYPLQNAITFASENDETYTLGERKIPEN